MELMELLKIYKDYDINFEFYWVGLYEPDNPKFNEEESYDEEISINGKYEDVIQHLTDYAHEDIKLNCAWYNDITLKIEIDEYEKTINIECYKYDYGFAEENKRDLEEEEE